jgi:hypothetical protein
MASKTAQNRLLLAVVIHWIYDALMTDCFMVRVSMAGLHSRPVVNELINLSQEELTAIAGIHEFT